MSFTNNNNNWPTSLQVYLIERILQNSWTVWCQNFLNAWSDWHPGTQRRIHMNIEGRLSTTNNNTQISKTNVIGKRPRFGAWKLTIQSVVEFHIVRGHCSVRYVYDFWRRKSQHYVNNDRCTSNVIIGIVCTFGFTYNQATGVFCCAFTADEVPFLTAPVSVPQTFGMSTGIVD